MEIIVKVDKPGEPCVRGPASVEVRVIVGTPDKRGEGSKHIHELPRDTYMERMKAAEKLDFRAEKNRKEKLA